MELLPSVYSLRAMAGRRLNVVVLRKHAYVEHLLVIASTLQTSQGNTNTCVYYNTSFEVSYTYSYTLTRNTTAAQASYVSTTKIEVYCDDTKQRKNTSSTGASDAERFSRTQRRRVA